MLDIEIVRDWFGVVRCGYFQEGRERRKTTQLRLAMERYVINVRCNINNVSYNLSMFSLSAVYVVVATESPKVAVK